LSELLAELERKDPELFAKIDQANRRRVVRAVEVTRLTGRPFSEQRAQWSGPGEGSSGLNFGQRSAQFLFGLERAPADLRTRIDRRVQTMFERGLVQETQGLLKQGLSDNRTALQAIGYRQVSAHLRGELSLDETIALVKQKSWQFAKRQMTWFRRQLPVRWLTLAEAVPTEDLARKLTEIVMD
jgi:tRNA dimethylallyltransferase